MKNFTPFSKLKNELLSDSEVRKQYHDLEPEYQLIRSVIDKRLKQKLSQQDLAQKIGTGQSAISRLESGESNPSMKFLQKVAAALGARLSISLQ
jgi:ribosome-binding protein aMBF1 (putative translation factor)